MIDYEAAIYTAVREAMLAEHPDVYLTSDLERQPAKLPCAWLYESDNSAYRNSQDSASNENHVEVLYQAEVFTKKRSSRKSEARMILQTIDNCMSDLGFTRMMMRPVPNYNDATIYRLIAQYRAVIGRDGLIYSR